MPGWGWRKFDPEGAFWSKVDRTGGPNACWPWLAAEDSNGYGAVKWGGKKQNAHRVALELKLGRPLGDRMLACHSRECTTRLCCNPAHLREGTSRDNVEDMHATGGFDPAAVTRALIKTNEESRFVGPPGTSWCVGCQDFLSESEFGKDAGRWNGLARYCRRCRKRMR